MTSVTAAIARASQLVNLSSFGRRQYVVFHPYCRVSPDHMTREPDMTHSQPANYFKARRQCTIDRAEVALLLLGVNNANFDLYLEEETGTVREIVLRHFPKTT